jgi:hypothetical protein
MAVIDELEGLTVHHFDGRIGIEVAPMSSKCLGA